MFDYPVADKDILCIIKHFGVIYETIDSDPSPLSYVVNGDILPRNQGNKASKTLSMYRWDAYKLGEFIASIESEYANILFENFLCDMTDNCLNSNRVVDTFYRYLTHVIENVCDTLSYTPFA